MEPGETRDRLTHGVFMGNEGDGVDLVEKAFIHSHETADIRAKMRKGGLRALDDDTIDAAVSQNLISEEEAKKIRVASDAVHKAIQVDHFDKIP